MRVQKYKLYVVCNTDKCVEPVEVPSFDKKPRYCEKCEKKQKKKKTVESSR